MARQKTGAAAGLPVRCTMVSIVVLRGRGRDTHMLVAHRSDTYLDGAWSYIAGHVEPGENGEQAARRELAEETALVPRDFYATTFCEQFYEPADACIEVVPAFVAWVDQDAVVRLSTEHTAYRWLPLADAAQAVPFGSQRELIAHVEREFVLRAPSVFLRLPGGS